MSTSDSREWEQFAPGVRRWQLPHRDSYVGTAEALAAAGIVRLDQLPGAPGMPKGAVRIFPDGTVPGGPVTANYREFKEPGARRVTWVSRAKGLARVVVLAGWEEAARRRESPDDKAGWRGLKPVPACVSAERDGRFQTWLARTLVGAAARGFDTRKDT